MTQPTSVVRRNGTQYVTFSGRLTSGGRLSASRIKSLAQSQRDLTIPATAADGPIPIVYGETPVEGIRRIFARGAIGGDLVLGIGWCLGEIEAVTKVYINDEEVPAGVTQTHYTGTTTQTADATLASAITAYNDDMVLSTPEGDIGVAYTVLRIPAGEIDSLTSIRGIIKGRKVLDDRTSTTAWSANTALCAADFIRNPIFGLGKTALGVADAANFCDEQIEGFERCRLALAITQPRSSVEHLDLLCMYAECVWFPEGDGIRIKPDRLIGADNPCGLDIVTNPGFDADSDWTKGTGWSIGSGVASSDGSQSAESSLTQTLTTEDGVKYAVSVEITARSAGSLRVEWAGTEIIAAQTATGTYTFCIQASGTSNALELIASPDFVGSVDNVTIKRLYWHETKVLPGSLQVAGLDDSDSPTRVSARYTDPSSVSGAWPEVLTSVALPGYDTGDVPPIDTTLSLPGVYRPAEASNKANARLQRMINRVRVSWQTTDHGIIHQLADVVQIYRPSTGVDILAWVESIEMIDYGRYQVTGMRYDEAHYPTELALPDNVGVVPVGAIVFNGGMSVPAGWSAYTDADGRFLVGAGGALSVGDTGGSDTFAGFSGDTESVDSHAGSSYVTYRGTERRPGATFGTVRGPENPPDLTHSHTYSTGTITPNPLARELKLIQKVSSAATEFPKDAQVLGLAGLAAPNLTRLTAAAGRLIKAASANASTGIASAFVSFVSGEASDAHDHRFSNLGNYDPDLTTNDIVYGHETGGGTHTHSYNLSLSRDVKRRRIAMYGGTDDYAVLPGMIVLWAGSLISLPTDWVLCDGAGLTPDLRDYFIEIASEGSEETAEGDNTLSVNGDGSSVGHDHQGDQSFSTQDKANYAHSNTISHAHNVTDSGAWTPPYYALAAIMFDPS